MKISRTFKNEKLKWESIHKSEDHSNYFLRFSIFNVNDMSSLFKGGFDLFKVVLSAYVIFVSSDISCCALDLFKNEVFFEASTFLTERNQQLDN